MKVFFGTLVFAILLVFAINFYVDPFGLKLKNLPHQRCAIDRALIAEGAQIRFRETLLQEQNPRVIVLGSSRVGKIRRNSLNSKSLVNFTLPNFGPDSYLRFAKELRKLPKPKVIFLGLEFYAFGNQGGFYKLADKIIQKSQTLGLERVLTRVFLFLYSMRGSTLFPSGVMGFLNFMTEYLSLPATERSLSLLQSRRFAVNDRELKLPQDSKAQETCLLSSTPTINQDGAWDPFDGSEYSPRDLSGEKRVSDFTEYNPSFFDGSDPSSHWHLFVGLSAISQLKMSVLEKLLLEFSEQNIRVIGFSSPFPDKIVKIWSNRGYGGIQKEFESKVSTLFQKYGGQYIVLPPSSLLGCNEFDDFDDAWHPGSECMDKAFKYLNVESPDLGAI